MVNKVFLQNKMGRLSTYEPIRKYCQKIRGFFRLSSYNPGTRRYQIHFVNHDNDPLRTIFPLDRRWLTANEMNLYLSGMLDALELMEKEGL